MADGSADCGVSALSTGLATAGTGNTNCQNGGASAAIITGGVDITGGDHGTFVGKMTSNDSVNTSDANGTAAFSSIDDWTEFYTSSRAWGANGSAFPNADNRGVCSSGTCRIWDFAYWITDTVNRAAVASAPNGDDALSHTFTNGDAMVLLPHCFEVLSDWVGDDDGRCESGETCVFHSNIGSFQGILPLGSAGTFTDGTVSGITLLEHSFSGYVWSPF